MTGTALPIVLVALTALTSIHYSAAADPECLYRQIRNLPMHWANPTDCGRFYRCTNKNVMREVVCTENKEYNPNTGKCTNTGKGLCTLTYAAPLEGETNDCAHEVDGAYIPDNGKCRDFYICLNKLAYPQKCDEGCLFNTTAAYCQPDKREECWQNVCLNQPDATTRPDHAACLSFYICFNNTAILQKCESGSFYNAIDGNCQRDVNHSNCWENFCLDAADGELVENPDNCNAYYSCQKKVATPMQCEKGSYFNFKLKKCEIGDCPSGETTTPEDDCTQPATIAPCESCTCPGGYKEGEMLPHPGNCMFYYICTGGVLVQKTCHAGNYYDKECKACKLDTAGVCPQCGSSSRRAKRSGNDIKTEIEDQWQPKAPKNCLGGYSHGEIIPHNECNKYQVCSDGQLETYDCEFGNYFDKDSKACMADEAKLCNTQSKSIERVLTCMDRYFEGQIAPHHDCNKYVVCLDGELKTQECGAGNYFNQNLEVCLPDQQNECKVQNIPFQQAMQTADCNDNRPSNNCTCPGGYESGKMLPHPNECNKYYICENGQLVMHDCGKGNMFDERANACVQDKENKCMPADESDCGADANICVGQPSGKLLPNKNKCYSFYQCVNGKAQANTCEAKEWFNPDKGFCEVDMNAVCRNPCLGITGIKLIRHPDCNKYYMCNNGEVHVRECSTGGFDPEIGLCSPDAKCASALCRDKSDGTAFEYPGDKKKFYVCLSNVAIINSCPDDSNFDPIVGVCLQTASINCNQSLCETDNLGAFSSLNGSENSFCTCRDGQAFEMHCATNYVFNSLMGICLSNAPCDPEMCLESPEYTVSENYKNNQSFCLCVSKEPVIVDCPKNGTFNIETKKCRPEATQDPNCDPKYCLDKPDYVTGPASSNSNGFCVCNDGGSKYYPCLDGYRYNIEMGVCVQEAAEYSCNITECTEGKKTIFPTFNDEYSFCYCETPTDVVVRNCPAEYKFEKEQLVCMPQFCDSKRCLSTANQNRPFPADNYPYGYCMCNGTNAKLYECAEGSMFDPNELQCTKEGNLQCNIKLCREEGKPYPYDRPAINDDYSFCYCLSPEKVEFFHCPVGKVYRPTFGVCMNEETPQPPTDCDDHCTCPGGYPAGSILPHPQNCSQYYICTKGVLKLSNCQTGNYFSASQNACAVDEEGKCKELISTPTSCVGAYHENEVIANPSNRRIFYRCLNTRLHLETCEVGHYFNANRGVCVPELMSKWNYNLKKSRSDIFDVDAEISDNDAEDNVINSEDVRSFKIFSTFFKKLTRT